MEAAPYRRGQLGQLLLAAANGDASNVDGDDSVDAALASLFADNEGDDDGKQKRQHQKQQQPKQQQEAGDDSERTQAKAKAKRLAARAKRRDSDPRNARTVFVGNVGCSVAKKRLLRLFAACGRVESIRFRSAAPAEAGQLKKLAVIRRQLGRQSLNAYVVFAEAAAAERAAAELNGSELAGLHLRVDRLPDEGTADKDPAKSVFLGNLSFNASEESVRVAFSQCGEVTNVRLVRDSATGVGKGFGYVQFADKDSVELALKLAGAEVDGRPLRVSRCFGDADAAARKRQRTKTGERKGGGDGEGKGKKAKAKRKARPGAEGEGDGDGEAPRPKKRKANGVKEKKAKQQQQQQQRQQSPSSSASTKKRRRVGKSTPTNRTFAELFQQRLDRKRARRLKKQSGAA